MSKNIRELHARKATLVQSARAITDKAAAENRDLTAEEAAQFDDVSAQIKSANASIEREQLLAAEEAGIQYTSAAQETHYGAGARVEDRAEADPRRGFRSFGEFAQSVQAAAAQGARPDQRLMIGAAAPGTVGNEGTGQDGGFLVPPQFSSDIWQLSLGEDSLLPLTDNTEVTGNSMVFPKDETTPWSTDGVRAYWQAEATAVNATKPKIGTTQMRLHKLMALVPLTDELLADANALQSYLPKKVANSIMWKTNESILFGTGVGQPLGALASKAIVTVAKESGQATATLLSQNISKMVSRLPSGSLRNAFWMMNNDVLPALDNLTLGNYPIYMPVSQGVQASPYGMLKGRPVNVSQHAASFSSQGDLILVDLSYYRTITKAGGMETATSMHLYFDADATAFRTTFRIDGQPALLNPINPAKGSNTLSPFVQLGAR